MLFIAWLGAGVVHPPRRAFLFLAVLLVGLSLPLFYERLQLDAGHPPRSRRPADRGRRIALLTIYLDIERARRVRMISAGRLAKIDGLTVAPQPAGVRRVAGHRGRARRSAAAAT